MAPDAERDAWLHVIKPAELDAHMASIGQAEANASIVREMFRRFPVARGGRALVHGCGSCQMFDYLRLSDLGEVKLTFADLSPAMIAGGRKRVGAIGCEFVVDDIEQSRLTGPYDAVLLVLVLLHVDWKKGLESMMRLKPSQFFIIEQEQQPGVSSITSTEGLPPSLQRYKEVAGMVLVPRAECVMFMNSRGYSLRWTTTVPVPGEKTMTGLVFGR